MTFTFHFTSKTFASFDEQKESMKGQYKEPYAKNDSESDETGEQDVLIYEGNGGDDFVYIDSEEDGVDGGNDPDQSPEEPLEMSEIVSNENAEDSFVIQGGGEVDSGHEVEGNARDAIAGYDDNLWKVDPLVDGPSVFELEKAKSIDFWNYDAVNWYTKEDQLAVEDAFQSQLIAVDSIGF